MDRTKLPEWRVEILRGRRSELLGWVRAKDESEALKEACEQYGIVEDWRRKRIVVRREP